MLTMISKPWKRVTLLFPILGNLLLTGVAWAEPAPTGVVARAEQLFATVEKRFDALQTLQYTVARTTQSARHAMQERWLFQYRQPGDMRIDYQQPQDRIIIVTSSNLVEYLPAVRKALRTNLAVLKLEERRQQVGSVLGRVAVDGLRVGDFRAMLERVQRITPDTQQAGAWWIEGEGPRFRVLIDERRQAVLSIQLWDARGDIKLQTAAGDWMEVMAGQWFPRRIQTTYGTTEGVVNSMVQLDNIHVNVPLEAGVFDFVPDRKVTVMER
jgi:outer membrane lipoprotein-sorting protein